MDEVPVIVVYVEDDERLGRLTAQYLTSHGLTVHLVPRGDLALGEVLKQHPDIILLDIMLPGLNGMEVCKQLRMRVNTPILMLTARGEEYDRVSGLEGGADDYITKPFSSRELLARIRAHVRRARAPKPAVTERLLVGSLSIDQAAMNVTLHGETVSLTTNEFFLLRALAERAGQVLTRDQLMQLTRGSAEEVFDRSIDVHIFRLRQKIEKDPRRPQLLKTVRGVGYLLVPTP